MHQEAMTFIARYQRGSTQRQLFPIASDEINNCFQDKHHVQGHFLYPSKTIPARPIVSSTPQTPAAPSATAAPPSATPAASAAPVKASPAPVAISPTSGTLTSGTSKSTGSMAGPRGVYGTVGKRGAPITTGSKGGS